MNANAQAFKPVPIALTLGDVDYTLVYDLNAFCELEKIYDSVDSVLQMLLGTTAQPDMEKVTYKDAAVDAADIKVADVPLSAYVDRLSKAKAAKHTDTLNLLWLGVIHDYAVYDKCGEITGYTIARATLGKHVTLQNMKEVNMKILTAFIRDLIPSDESKNAEAPVSQALQ